MGHFGPPPLPSLVDDRRVIRGSVQQGAIYHFFKSELDFTARLFFYFLSLHRYPMRMLWDFVSVKLFKAYIHTWINCIGIKLWDLLENLSRISVSTFKDLCRNCSKNALSSLLQITSEVLPQMLPGLLQVPLKILAISLEIHPRISPQISSRSYPLSIISTRILNTIQKTNIVL